MSEPVKFIANDFPPAKLYIDVAVLVEISKFARFRLWLAKWLFIAGGLMINAELAEFNVATEEQPRTQPLAETTEIREG